MKSFLSKISDQGKKFFPGVTHMHKGKVALNYVFENEIYAAIRTDTISAFDVVFPFEVKDKGRILTLISKRNFEATRDIVPNYFICSPNSRTIIGCSLTMFPVEIIVRAYLAGSMWRNYKAGQRLFWGTELPDGMKHNQRLPEVMVTPTTKAELGHDDDITVEKIISNGLMKKNEWSQVETFARNLFQRGTEMMAKQGLILVDTKYEFGKQKNGLIMLGDELHTPDSSRFWTELTYQNLFEQNLPQNQLSKEFFREMLMNTYEYKGEDGVAIPKLDDEAQKVIRNKYLSFYQAIMGEAFNPPADDSLEEILKTTKKELYHYGVK